MPKNNHPSDEVLLKVVHDHNEGDIQTEIETHITACEQCKTRLMKLADEDWLNEYRDCLTQELFSLDSNSGLERTADRSRLNGQGDFKSTTNEFESGAIQQMLSKILAPGTHPETMGSLGRYEVEQVVGVGGMGVVLRGFDRELQRPVAIKMMLPGLANNGTAKQRFKREARSVAAILHPNVIAIHGVDETNNMPWFVMPYIAGPSLRELVDRNGPIPEREIARIGLQIASGLAAAHGQGLVHRDIKPANILVDNSINRVVITDFGLAHRETEETLTRTGFLAGTLNYMSPEQTKGEDVDGRSDLFSLGALLYFLATGSPPFRSATPAGVLHNVCNKRPADVRTLNPEISKTLSHVIDSLLSKRPSRRFQSAAELEKFFEEYVSFLNSPTRHRIPRVVRNRIWPVAALGTGILCVFLSIGWGLGWFNSLPSPPEPLTAEQLWSQIREKYELTDPDSLPAELAQMDEEIERFGRQLQPLEAGESSELSDELSEMATTISRFESRIDRLGRSQQQVAVSDSEWTNEQARRSALEFNDPSKWDSGYRVLDLKRLKNMTATDLALPFPYTSFTAPSYERVAEYSGRQFPGLSCGALQSPQGYVGSAVTIKNLAGGQKAWKEEGVEPLMFIVVSGTMPLKNVEQQALSRSHPHYFFQGSFTNAVGDVDWMAIKSASGKKVGIVNGRVLDLSFGNLILVRQMDDGSIRIFQKPQPIQNGKMTDVYQQANRAIGSLACQEFLARADKFSESDKELPFPFELKSGWTPKLLASHYANYNNSNQWSQKLLEGDAKQLKRPLPDALKGMPFPWVGFPVPAYLYKNPVYGGLSVGPVQVKGAKAASGFLASVNRRIDPQDIPEGKTWKDVKIITEPLMTVVAKGDSPFSLEDQWGISRSLPNFFFQGFMENKHGQIDWVAMKLSDGTKIGIINGRILDLDQGNLILVRQHESGMISIFQSQEPIEPGSSAEIKKAVNQRISNEDSPEASFWNREDVFDY